MKTNLILIILLMISFKMFGQKKCSEAIQSAIENDDLATVKQLIQKGEKINCIGEWEQTLLMEAVQSGKEEIALYLLSQNADIHQVDDENNSALFKTSFFGLTSVAKLLLEKGADVNQRANREITTLMMASNRNQLALVKLLVEKGADINLQCNSGYTALTYTTSPAVLSYLLSKNADPNLKSFQELDALEQFKASLEGLKDYGSKESIANHQEIIRILKEEKY